MREARCFGFATTSEQVIAGVDLTGKTVVITGASSGLGLHTAATLASAGAEVVAAVRNPDDLGELTGRVETVPLNLADLGSVRAAAAHIGTRCSRIDLLINNAGIMFTPHQTSVDGFKLQFAVNHLGHFLLTTSLLPQLSAAAAASGDARVVTLSSAAHLRWGIDLDDINFGRRGYDRFAAYGQSKTANVLMTVELDRRHAADGITALAVHPGTCQTNLGRHMDRETFQTLYAMGPQTFAPENMKSVSQAAATTVWAATAPAPAGRGGSYLADCRTAAAAPWATDPAAAQRLWQLSQQWTTSPV